MKLYRLLVLVVALCVPGLVMGMQSNNQAIILVKMDQFLTYNDVCNAIDKLYNIIDSSSSDNNIDESQALKDADEDSTIGNMIKNCYSVVRSLENKNYLIASEEYNQIFRLKYLKLFNNKISYVEKIEVNEGLKIIFPNGEESNGFLKKDFLMLMSKFINFIYKKQSYGDHVNEQNKNKRASDLFDDLINLRLECANFLHKYNFSKEKNTILDFSPLALSRWNPFGWGNWYDRLHRKVSSLPLRPWDEDTTGKQDHNRALVIAHLFDIQDNMAHYGELAKPVMQLYVCIMRELRILIKTKLTDTGRNTLRYIGGGLGVLGLLGFARYFGRGKAANQNNDPNNSGNPKKSDGDSNNPDN